MLDGAAQACPPADLRALHFLPGFLQGLAVLLPPADFDPFCRQPILIDATRLPCLTGISDSSNGAMAFTSATVGLMTCLFSSPKVL